MSPPVCTPTGRAAAIYSAVLLVLGVVWWGGGTTRPAQIATLAGVGLLWLFAPPSRYKERFFAACAAALILLASTAWLSAVWFPSDPLRQTVAAMGVAPSSTISPQPWISAEALLWFLTGMGWTAWLLGQPWDAALRRRAAAGLASGVVALAAIALGAWVLHRRVPGWLSDRGFGPFPNRNHLGHVLALGGILALGCGVDAAWRGWRHSVGWLAGAAVILVALVVNNSRGGLLLFLGAVGLWSMFTARERRSWKTLALGGAFVCILVSGVLIGGGPVAARFAGGADSQVSFRTLIWRDTLALVHAAPWCGAGLGNFAAIFPLLRHDSVNQQSVLHPESDWLWLAAELGWLGPVLVAAALGGLLWGAFPLVRGTQRRLRGAALAGAIAAVFHAAIDVPGHRFGSALLALFVVVLARRDPELLPASKTSALVSRIVGLAALGLAVLVFEMPDETARAKESLRTGHFAEAADAANRALVRAPLDWNLYFIRAGARACLGQTLAAVADFRVARRLEPHYAGIPLEEGIFWLQTQPELTLIAWREALRRVPSPEDGAVFGVMLTAAPDNPAFRSRLLLLAESRPHLQLAWFQSVPPEEARAHFEEISAAAGSYDARQRATFQRRAGEIGILGR